MATCTLFITRSGRLIPASSLWHCAGTILLCIASFPAALAQSADGATQAAQSFALSDTNDLMGAVPATGKAEAVEYLGRKAVRLTAPSSEDVFDFLKGVQFQDGVIEADIALKITTPPGVRMPGFVGIAFRARPDTTHYEMFYLRPGNSHAEDQAQRNHSVQYVAAPGFDWYKLRREWPSIYESHAELKPETWIHMKIEVHGRAAKLYLDGSESPSLIVNGLKGEDLAGGVAIWGYNGEEAYFSHLKVAPAAPEAVTNDGEAAGTWDVKFPSDFGRFEGTMSLEREGNAVKGAWTGAFGQSMPVSGTWRNGYVELTFNGMWQPEKDAPAVPATATLAGWIDGDSAAGRMKVEGKADGPWTAQRKSASAQ
ncbi:MAG TPA: hypothetical protein VKR52_07815 [Terracidiphilus sp.]|nr:hypothetical protein [Terracidiphilus sp.]